MLWILAAASIWFAFLHHVLKMSIQRYDSYHTKIIHYAYVSGKSFFCKSKSNHYEPFLIYLAGEEWMSQQLLYFTSDELFKINLFCSVDSTIHHKNQGSWERPRQCPESTSGIIITLRNVEEIYKYSKNYLICTKENFSFKMGSFFQDQTQWEDHQLVLPDLREKTLNVELSSTNF